MLHQLLALTTAATAQAAPLDTLALINDFHAKQGTIPTYEVVLHSRSGDLIRDDRFTRTATYFRVETTFKKTQVTTVSIAEFTHEGTMVYSPAGVRFDKNWDLNSRALGHVFLREADVERATLTRDGGERATLVVAPAQADGETRIFVLDLGHAIVLESTSGKPGATPRYEEKRVLVSLSPTLDPGELATVKTRAEEVSRAQRESLARASSNYSAGRLIAAALALLLSLLMLRRNHVLSLKRGLALLVAFVLTSLVVEAALLALTRGMLSMLLAAIAQPVAGALTGATRELAQGFFAQAALSVPIALLLGYVFSRVRRNER